MDVMIQNNDFFFDSANSPAFFFSEWNILCIFAAVFVLRKTHFFKTPSTRIERGRKSLICNRNTAMNDNTAAKIYEWMSYVLIVGATVVFFATG